LTKSRKNSLPADRREHRVLGPVYRVPQLTTGLRGELKKEVAELTEATPTVPKRRRVATPQAAVKAEDEMEENKGDDEGDSGSSTPDSSTESSSESSSSSCSSSAPRGKKSKKRGKGRRKAKKAKKSKKSKKHSKEKAAHKKKKMTAAEEARAKRESEKVQRQQDKADEKAKAAKVSFAGALVAKLSGPIASLAATFANPASVSVPDVVLAAAKQALEELQNMEKAAKLVQQHPKTKDMPITAIKEVTPLLSKAKKCEQLMQQMLNGIGKLM